MTLKRVARNLVDEFRQRPTVRAGSLIVTVFGDAVAPRGGPVWVGSLINALDAFGVSERLVRTSVYRLAADGWLESTAIGRRSFYGLTLHGRSEHARASQRIYGEPRQSWDGEWCVLLLGGVASAERDELKRELEALGFGAVSAGVMAHPGADARDLAALLDRRPAGGVVVLTGQTDQDLELCAMARKSWDLEGIESRYLAFLDRFRPALAAAERSGRIDPHEAFIVRTLLVHEYRKIVLRDPLLPVELLPGDWHGFAAYRLCRNLYRAVRAAADRYVDETFETPEGPLPPPGPSFAERFGGLA